jgi:predicted RNase H-like HicB family nuclease
VQELLFLVEEDREGGYTAQAVSGSHSIFTEADTLEELKSSIMDALRCHFDDESKIPALIRLHYVKDETIRVGTLNNILNNVAQTIGVSKESLLADL